MQRLNRQGGQGMVTFVIAAAFVLVPISLGINYLLKIAEAKHKTYEAARYAIWERTVWHQDDSRYNTKPDIDVSREISQRVFAEGSRPLDSELDRQDVLPRDVDLDPNLYAWEPAAPPVIDEWGRSGELNELQVTDSEMPVSYSSGITRVASSLLGQNTNGFYSASVKVNLHKHGQWKDQWDLLFPGAADFNAESSHAMLVGSWNANGPEDVGRSVTRSLATELLNNSAFRGVQNILSMVGFKELGWLEMGKIDPEQIPCQRAVGGNQNRNCQ